MIVVTFIARFLCWWFALGCSLGLCWVAACLTIRRFLRSFPATRLESLAGFAPTSPARQIAASNACRLLSTAPVPRRLAPQSRLARRDAGRSPIMAARHSA